jgi:hypothetical protein
MMLERNAVAFAAALLVAGFASAQTAPATTGSAAATTTAAPESPLVKAARDAAAKRESGNKQRPSITDKDVKKSAGKLIETTSKPLPPVPSAAAEIDKRQKTERAAAEVKEREREAIAARVGKMTDEVATLEKELRRIEESYYDEDDPDFREDVIEKRFEDTKAKLEKARQDLEAAKAAAAARDVSTP